MRSTTIIALLLLFAAAGAMPHGKFGMPVSCAGMDYCTEKHELYPQAVVDRLVRTISTNISSLDPQAESSGSSRDHSEKIRRKRSVDSDCNVIFSIDPIYEIIDADGDVRVVLQTEGFRQIVSIERCLHLGHINYETVHFNAETIQNYNLLCVQRKLDISFMALTRDWEGLEMIKPKTGIPIGCDILLINM